MIVTATGLIFIAGKDAKLRAYDEDTGKVLWTYRTARGLGRYSGDVRGQWAAVPGDLGFFAGHHRRKAGAWAGNSRSDRRIEARRRGTSLSPCRQKSKRISAQTACRYALLEYNQ